MSQKKVDWAIYDIDIFNLLKIYPNVTFFTKTFKFINMFLDIKNKKIMNHMKYIYILENHMNISQMTKFNHHTLNAFFTKLKQPIHVKHHVDINEHAHNSIYINIYNKKIQDVPIIPYFYCESLFFLNNLNIFQINCQNKVFKFK